jgi:hypothetical protein
MLQYGNMYINQAVNNLNPWRQQMTKIKLQISNEEKSLMTALECSYDDITAQGNGYYKVGGEEYYLVCTDEEADVAVTESIKESAWAFRSEFLANFTSLPEEVFTALQDKCEGANEPILKLIDRTDGGLKAFVEEAVSVDGRGHFLAQYDGQELEVKVGKEYYFIYRVN